MAKVMLKTSSPKSGEPGSGIIEEKVVLKPGRVPIDQGFDLRDRLSELVGKGNTLNTDDKAAIYGNLVTMLGKDKALKVLNHAYIFNARPDVQGLPIEEKLKSFYTVGSNDPDVAEVIGKTKNLGYGILPGFRGSASAINQELMGRNQVAKTDVSSPEIQRKVKLKLRK